MRVLYGGRDGRNEPCTALCAVSCRVLHTLEVPPVPPMPVTPAAPARSGVATVLVSLLGLCAAMAALAEPGAPQPFTAVYALEWHGLSVGDSTLTLGQIAPATYEYRSVNRARGLFHLAFPDPISERSVFTVVNGHVAPLSYGEDDGRTRADQNVTLQFDWKTGRVRGMQDGKPVDQPLESGTQDPLSVQIELMRDLAAGSRPTHFLLFDKDEAEQYRYTRERTESLDTPLGRLDTVVYRSDRQGSDRVMRLWLAPSLGYMPIQAERWRKGKSEFELHIRSLKTGSAAPPTAAVPARSAVGP